MLAPATPDLWTLGDAATYLDPPITARQLRTLVRELGIPAAGWRHNGRAGHPSAAYRPADLQQLHAALLPWLEKG